MHLTKRILFFIILAFLIHSLNIYLYADTPEDDPFYWEPHEYGYNPYRTTEVNPPQFAVIRYFEQIEWDRESRDMPAFIREIPAQERHYKTSLWKTYYDLEDIPYKAVFFFNGQVVYTLLYYWHEDGLVLKIYYQYTQDYKPQYVLFYDQNNLLIIKEIYDINGQLSSITTYDETSTPHIELRGNDNYSPYFWWGP